MTHVLYTAAEVRTLCRLRRRRKSAEQIAKALGRSTRSVQRRLSRMKLKSLKRYTRHEIQLIRELSAAGKSAEVIAATLRRPVPGLKKKLAELEIFSRKFSKADEKKIRKLKRQGLSAPQIAAEFPGRTLASIREKLRRMGLGCRLSQAEIDKRKTRRMSDVEHREFCNFLRNCTQRAEPMPALEIWLYWNRAAQSSGRKEVGYDKVEYWLRKLNLPMITGKVVKRRCPKAHQRRIRAKVNTLHRRLDERDACEREALRKLRQQLLNKRPKPKLSPCPRCSPNEGPWPITPEFFRYRRNSSGTRVACTESCTLCLRKRSRTIHALKLNGASNSEVNEYRRKDNYRALERRRALGISAKRKRA